MIIKIEENRKGIWHFFDSVEQLTYRKLPDLNAMIDPLYVDVFDYSGTLSEEKSDSQGYPGRVFLEFMQDREIVQIVAFSPVYLMNENGKTIEIL